MQIFAIVVSLALTIAAVALLVPAVQKMLGVIRSGQPAPGRTDNPVGRGVTMLKETFLHTRMLQWHWVGIMHWFVYMAFLFLSTAVLAAYFQLFQPDFAWPIVGHWYPFEWFSEVIGLLSTVGIVFLIIYRQKHHPRSEGRKSRFFGSTFWQAYFVEALALLEGAAILFVRGAEWKLDEEGGRSHYPISSWIGDALYADSTGALHNTIFFIAMFKIALAMVWLMVIARNITMGIAWHRFTAWFNIYFKRESDGSTALGAMKPLTSGGKAITLDDIDDLDEDSILGVGSIEDFSWKGILDFTTCTECGRCQSQCPAWNTEKPLSPKLLIMGLRDHAYAKAAEAASSSDSSDSAPSSSSSEGGVAVAEKSLIGSGMEDNWFYNPEGADYVIDEDVLWSCTSCGACVQQCPVDIEHVDHIMDMRRYQVLVESNFPAELNGLFKGLENKGNPWNMSSTARMDWAKGLEFDVPVVGEDLESLESVDWLFWVGCAGAYEDRAKKTTRAVAELLNMAGVSFGVLGNGETCTGDPARRAGNEFVFQGLAQQNVETFKEFKVKKVVSTCAHCFNTLKNEYKDFGIELEVVHHTQLLNRLVREGKLTPIKEGAGAAKRSITYHDPCYLGRHNQVYEPPRELLEILPGAEFKEMERNSEKSFCCGAGGARMWMEENIGERINLNRTKEAVGTGADQIAVGCPFCRVMLADGLTAEQAAGNAREEVEVLDVAQMLLASVKGESATRTAPGSSAAAAASSGTAKAASAPAAATDVATKAEPEAGDVTITEDTVTETADAGPAAKASGGSSLFDTPAPAAPAPAASSGGSLFDTPAPEQAKAEPEKKAEPTSGGSLFDLGEPEPAAPATASDDPAAPATDSSDVPESSESKAATKPAADLGSGGSLFDLAEPEAAPAAQEEPAAKAEAEPEPDTKAEPAAPAAAAVGSTGSLFDIAAPDPTPSAKVVEPEPEAATSDEAAAPTTESSDVPESTDAEPEPEPEVAVEEPAETAPAATSSGTVSTPATSIPEGGSLFDIEAPAAANAPAAKAVEPEPTPEPEPEAEPEAATSDEEVAPATESSDVPEPTDVEPEPAAAGEEPAEAAPAATSSGTVSTPATSIPEGGSLFDIEAPTPVAAAPKAEPEPAPEPTPEPTPAPEAATSDDPAAPATESSDVPESTETLSAGAALSQAATFAAADDDPDTILDADEAPEAPAGAQAEPEAEAEAEPDGPADVAQPAAEPDEAADESQPDTDPESSEAPKPASGAVHTPKTDVDINAAGSLFDL